VTGVFPLGIQRGAEADIHVEGVYLGATRIVHLKAPADAAPGSRLPVPLNTPNGSPLGAIGIIRPATAAATDEEGERLVLDWLVGQAGNEANFFQAARSRYQRRSSDAAAL